MQSQSGWLSSIPQQTNVAGDAEPLHISSGATCDVYRLQEDGRFYIIKRLKDEHMQKESYHQMFRKEYEVGCDIHNEYFPRYFEIDDNSTAITLEYIDGITLRESVLKNPEYFRNFRNLRRIIAQIAEALSVLHSHQVVHLDLKPDNIMLTTVNRDVRILDLGYCYTDSAPFTMGRTSNYAAPEQFDANRHVDARTDVFAIGKIIDFILDETGYKSRVFRRISRRCTKEDPAQRYQKVEDILRELNSFIRRNVITIVLSIVIVTAVSVFAYFGYHRVDYDVVSGDINHLHLRYINDGKELEVVPYYTWGGSYSGSVFVPREFEVDDKQIPVTKIASHTFYQCKDLTAINIPQSVKVIGDYAFSRCSELTILTLPDSLQMLGVGSFWGCDNLGNLVLPSTLKEIPNSCFTGCGFEEIIIPEGVETVCMDALAFNERLKKVSLPSTLKTLERGVFWECRVLERIDIPAGVTYLGDFLLWHCDNLKAVYNHAVTPQPCTGIVDKDFKGVIYVPRQSVEAYKHAKGWEGLNIQPMS